MITLKKVEEPNEILLSIGTEIARIRGKQDMVHLIGTTIKKYIRFDDSFIFRYDRHAKSCRCYIYQAEAALEQDPEFIRDLHFEYIIEDTNINDHPLPVAQDVKSLMTTDLKKLAFMRDVSKAGVKKYVSIKLIERNQLIGFLVLLSKQNSSFTPDELNLLNRIKHSVAIATANIIANEDIANREQEKEILLSLSDEIARVRNKNELLLILADKLRELFSITGFGITLLNEDGKSHSPFVVEGYQQTFREADYKALTLQKYPVNDNVYNIILNKEDPCILEVDEILKISHAPAYVHLWKTKGLKRVLGAALRVGTNAIGCLIFHLDENNKKPVNLNLIKGVSAQISVAISNIKANDEIARREEEKVILLSLSNEIAAIKNRKDFFEIVNFQLKSLFEIQEFGIAQINADRKTYSAFILELEDRIKNHSDFARITSARYEVTDPIFSVIMNSELPVLFDVHQLLKKSAMPDYVGFWKNVGLRRVLGVPLREGGAHVGCIFLHVDGNEALDLKSKLLTGVCAQLAVKMSDISAREEIERREKEKSKLLSFSNALASIMNRKQLSVVLSEELKKFGIVGNYGISVLTEDNKHFETILFDESDGSARDPEFRKILDTAFEIQEDISSVILHSDQPVTFKIQELKKRKIMLPCVSWWEKTGVVELTGIAIKLGDKRGGFLWLGIAEVYDKEHNYPLLKSISSQIGIALSNLLAHEKIVSQLHEIKLYKEQLEEEIIYLQEEMETSQNYSEIIGESNEIKKVFRMITQVSQSDSTVLLLGETGTGKELIARAIHNSSQRENKLMVKVNCAALPANLIESELFGHEKGSFTGAIERRIGKFELAKKGTLFLDEIGEMPMDLQVKLLRALQEKEIERVGGRTTIQTDVRIIAATNRDLEKLMEEGKFRSDLYYRLNIFPIALPPLRNRREDIPQLASYFIARYSKKTGKKIKGIHNKALKDLIRYHWPGNIRELEHLVERSVLLTNGDTIKEINLPQNKNQFNDTQIETPAEIKTIDQHEKEYILKVLKFVNGRIGGEGGAAELLGLPTSTLNSRMKRLGIRKAHLG